MNFLVHILIVIVIPLHQIPHEINGVSPDSDLVGHLKPLGHQQPPDVVTEELHTVPQPQEFWENYVRVNKPVLFRGAAKNSR